jgi:hypothetical protein
MRKLLEVLAFTSLLLLWSLAVVSIPFIPETCIVCGCQQGENHSEDLRTMSMLEWLMDTVPDVHFSCAKDYDSEIHNPNGGLA